MSKTEEETSFSQYCQERGIKWKVVNDFGIPWVSISLPQPISRESVIATCGACSKTAIIRYRSSKDYLSREQVGYVINNIGFYTVDGCHISKWTKKELMLVQEEIEDDSEGELSRIWGNCIQRHPVVMGRINSYTVERELIERLSNTLAQKNVVPRSPLLSKVRRALLL